MIWKLISVILAASMGLTMAAQSPLDITNQGVWTPGIKNIVLVHGAWADGSSWAKIIPLLEARGLHVVAVQLHLTSLADDADVVKRAVALQDGPVLLIGHSYGGAVITEAGNDPKIAGLVYVAAFAPDQGQSALDQGAANPTAGTKDLAPDTWGFTALSPEVIQTDFAQDLSEIEKRVLIATQGPTSVAALGGKVTITAWANKPSWFIIAANDRMISPDLERAEANKMKAVSITLDSSHVPMLAHPFRVAAFISEAARKSGGR